MGDETLKQLKVGEVKHTSFDEGVLPEWMTKRFARIGEDEAVIVSSEANAWEENLTLSETQMLDMTLGWKFRVLQRVRITKLGVFAYSDYPAIYKVHLWRILDGNGILLETADVEARANEWCYSDLYNSVDILPGIDYVISMNHPIMQTGVPAGVDVYYSESPIVNGVIEYKNGVYAYGNNVFPNKDCSPDRAYGVGFSFGFNTCVINPQSRSFNSAAVVVNEPLESKDFILRTYAYKTDDGSGLTQQESYFQSLVENNSVPQAMPRSEWTHKFLASISSENHNDNQVKITWRGGGKKEELSKLFSGVEYVFDMKSNEEGLLVRQRDKETFESITSDYRQWGSTDLPEPVEKLWAVFGKLMYDVFEEYHFSGNLSNLVIDNIRISNIIIADARTRQTEMAFTQDVKRNWQSEKFKSELNGLTLDMPVINNIIISDPKTWVEEESYTKGDKYKLDIEKFTGNVNLVIIDHSFKSVAIAIDNYKITGPQSSSLACAPKKWEVQGSFDSVHWITLDTVVGQIDWSAYEIRHFNLNNLVEFPYYRLNILENNGDLNSVEFVELELLEGDVVKTIGGISAWDTEWNSSYRGYNLFDNNIDTAWKTAGGKPYGWVFYNFRESITPTYEQWKY